MGFKSRKNVRLGKDWVKILLYRLRNSDLVWGAVILSLFQESCCKNCVTMKN